MARPEPNICSQKWGNGVVWALASIWMTSWGNARSENERTRARSASRKGRSRDMGTSVEIVMVNRGQNVVIGWWNVVIWRHLTWWKVSNGAGFFVCGDKKMLVRENAPQVGQLNLSRLSNCGPTITSWEAKEEAAHAAASPPEFSAVRS